LYKSLVYSTTSSGGGGGGSSRGSRQTNRQTRELSSRQVAMQGEARRRWCCSATEGADDLTAVTDWRKLLLGGDFWGNY